jgi:hypothetical protein
MLKDHPPNEPIPRNGDPPREFTRVPVVIPVRVQILTAKKGSVVAAAPGVLLNIGCGGGRVRVRWELSAGTRVLISLPVGTPVLHLLAEVVWGSRPSELGNEPSVFGVRWSDPMSMGTLQAVLLGQGLMTPRESAHVSQV